LVVGYFGEWIRSNANALPAGKRNRSTPQPPQGGEDSDFPLEGQGVENIIF